METTISKISEVEYQKVIPQEDLIEIKTLDDLLTEQISLQEGIKNNQDRILEQQAKLDEVKAEITTVKSLGVKTQEEVKPIEEKLPIENIIK